MGRIVSQVPKFSFGCVKAAPFAIKAACEKHPYLAGASLAVLMAAGVWKLWKLPQEGLKRVSSASNPYSFKKPTIVNKTKRPAPKTFVNSSKSTAKAPAGVPFVPELQPVSQKPEGQQGEYQRIAADWRNLFNGKELPVGKSIEEMTLEIKQELQRRQALGSYHIS